MKESKARLSSTSSGRIEQRVSSATAAGRKSPGRSPRAILDVYSGLASFPRGSYETSSPSCGPRSFDYDPVHGADDLRGRAARRRACPRSGPTRPERAASSLPPLPGWALAEHSGRRGRAGGNDRRRPASENAAARRGDRRRSHRRQPPSGRDRGRDDADKRLGTLRTWTNGRGLRRIWRSA